MTLFLSYIIILFISVTNAIDEQYVLQPSHISYQLSLNTLLSVPEYDNGLFYNFWISSEASNTLFINKFTENSNTTYNITISSLNQNISPKSISADYIYSNTKHLAILLAISYTVTNSQNESSFIQVYQFNEDFSNTQNDKASNDTIVAVYSNNKNDAIPEILVNILYNYDNETFQIVWNGKHINTRTDYQHFDPCLNIDCFDNGTNIYSATYNLSTMTLVEATWNLLSGSTISSNLPNLYPSSTTLYYATEKSRRSMTCYSTIYSNGSNNNYYQYKCVRDSGDSFNQWIIKTLYNEIVNNNIAALPKLDVTWVESDGGKSGIFVVYEDGDTVYGKAMQFDAVESNNLINITDFILPSYPYNNTNIYKAFNPLVTNAYPLGFNGKYMLITWIVADVGLFANIFNLTGHKLICSDVPIYISKNVTSVAIASNLGYGIITFTTYNGIGNQIIGKLMNYTDHINNGCRNNNISTTISTTSYNGDGGRVTETSTTQHCLYEILLSFTAISNGTTYYFLTENGKNDFLNDVKYSLDVTDIKHESFDVMIENTSIISIDLKYKYKYSMQLLFCMFDDDTYNAVIETLEKDQDKFIMNLVEITDIDEIEDFQIIHTENGGDDDNKEEFTEYIIYGVVGILLLLIGLCCMCFYCILKPKDKSKGNSEFRYNSEKPKSLDPGLQTIKHELVPSNEYQVRKEMEIAQLDIPNKLSVSPKLGPKAPKQSSNSLLSVRNDTLDRAAQKSLPPSRSITIKRGFSSDDGLNESMYQNPNDAAIKEQVEKNNVERVKQDVISDNDQIISKNSTVYYDPTEDAKLYGGNSQNNNVQVIAMDTMYQQQQQQENDKKAIISGPRSIPKLKTFVAQNDNDYQNFMTQTNGEEQESSPALQPPPPPPPPNNGQALEPGPMYNSPGYN